MAVLACPLAIKELTRLAGEYATKTAFFMSAADSRFSNQSKKEAGYRFFLARGWAWS